jgi:aspartate kinase
MIVMKFGGATVQDASALQNVIGIVRGRLHAQPVLVVSAMGKTTRTLLTAAQVASTGDAARAETALEVLRVDHEDVARGLVTDWDASEGAGKLETYFRELRHLLNGIAILRELSPRIQDRVLSYGELISTAIVSESLVRHGVPAHLLDARDLVITDDRFTQASPLSEPTNARVRDAVLPLVRSGKVPVLQGFIGSCRSGATTTLGFEGSDFTAALAGAAIGASEVQIWKEVPGMMTADPDVVQEASTVQMVSYEEAAELTRFGAKVLHPRTVDPVLQRSIPIRIAFVHAPDSAGTLIAGRLESGGPDVKSIAYRKPMCLLRIEATGDSAIPMAADAVACLDRYRVPPSFLSVAGPRLVAAVPVPDAPDDLIESLRVFGSVDWLQDRATVSLIGTGVRQRLGDALDAVRKIDGSAIEAMAFGVSPINCTLVVPESVVLDAVRILHRCFFGPSNRGL